MRREPRTSLPANGRGAGLPVDTGELASVLDEFAATVTQEFSLDDILRQLAQAVTRVLQVHGAGVAAPGADGAAVRMVYASSGPVQELELSQEKNQEGPCVESLASGRVINLADIGVEGRWPAYQERAVALGVHAVTTVPLVARDHHWGVLDLYREAPLPLSAAELAAARTLAHLATSYLVVADDRDTARRAQSELAERAMRDTLTGLPVRWVFLEHLAHALARLRRGSHHVAVLFLDLDGLKYVNDTYGHAAGDRLILAGVERVRATLRPSDLLARIGGDEFVVLLEDLAHAEDATEVARRALEALSVPYRTDGHPIPLSASIGVATTTEFDTAGATLIAHADSAMYQAKRAGRGSFEVFDPARYARERSSASRQERLARELELALDRGELEVHYQPIIDLDQGSAGRGRGPYAVEALARWRHPERGLLNAGAFIDIAERSGLLPALGGWILRTACRQLSDWDRRLGDGAPRFLFVNVAPVELLQPEHADVVARGLEEAGIEPGRLTVEITESALAQETEAAAAAIEALRTLGCRVAIDDFGTGYSSLSRLIDIAATTVKIDKAFTHGLGSRSGAVAIISAVKALGDSLQRIVIAEGVEDEETLQQLRELGIRHVQGYHLSVPMSAEDLVASGALTRPAGDA